MTPEQRGAEAYLPGLFRYMETAHGRDWTPEDLGLMVLEDAVAWEIIPPGPVPAGVQAVLDEMKGREGMP